MPKIAEMSPIEPGHLLGRELVPDDRDGERDDAAADALQHAAGDDHLERVSRAPTTALPAANTSREATNRRRLPSMSPSRPAIGVATAAASR